MDKFRTSKHSGASNLLVRGFSGIFITTIILSAIHFGNYYWNGVVSLIAIISLYEFYSLLSVRYNISPYLIFAGGLFLLVSAVVDSTLASMLCAVSLVTFISLFIEIIKKQKGLKTDALRNMGISIAGILYVILPWTFLIIVRTQNLGTMFLYTLFFCTWTCDVFAYITGNLFGAHKLCLNVSPNKTWEGFLGGFVASAVTGAIVAYCYSYSVLPMVLLGCLLGLSGQMGDLAESLLKREAGVKDSGNIIPGHGGFLDRFDSILINAVIIFLIVELIG